MRTVFAAVLVGCASAAAHAGTSLPRHVLPSWAAQPSTEPIGIEAALQPPIPAEPGAQSNTASITPGTVVLSLIALGGIALGKYSNRRPDSAAQNPDN